METIISKPQDSFSFRRVKMVGGYYYPIFKRQLWIYPSLSLAAGILTFLFKYFSEYFGAGFLGATGFLTGLIVTAMTFMFYWSPCVLGNDGRELEVSLPALWSEKAVFLIAYFFVAIPLLVFGPYIIVRSLLIYLFIPGETIIELQRYTFSMTVAGSNIGLSSVDSLVALSTAFYVMICSRRRSFARAAVLSIVALIGVGIMSGIMIFTRILNVGLEKVASYAESDSNMHELISSLDIDYFMLLTSGVCLAYVVLMVVLSVRSIKRIQI